MKLNGTILSVTSTQITGTVKIPADVSSGVYDLVVTTIDGGTTVKPSTFTINYLPLPTILTINQTSGFRNSTVTFNVAGKNFQTDGTYIRLYLNSSVTPVNAVLTSVTDSNAIGSFTIPYNQPSGKYRLDLITVSGGSTSRLTAFTINPVPAPSITAISPTVINQNNTFLMTVNGDNFQTGSGTYTLTDRSGQNGELHHVVDQRNQETTQRHVYRPPDCTGSKGI